MATIGESINSGLCAYQDTTGTEVSKGCINQIKKTLSIWYIKPGEEFRVGETFADEFARLITASKLVVLRGVDTFEENGNDDSIDASSSGVEQVTLDGLYKFSAGFRNGMYFNKAMNLTLKGFKKWNTLHVTQDGIYGTKSTLGGLTGFTTGMIQPMKVVQGTDTTAQKEGINYQFLDRYEFDVDFAFVADTTLRKQKGVTEVELSFVNAPADGDTTLTIKAHIAQDKAESFTGIDYAKFLVTDQGATSNPSAGDDSTTTGTFVLTGVTAINTGDVVTAKLFASNASVIVGADGDYYKSNTITATTV